MTLIGEDGIDATSHSEPACKLDGERSLDEAGLHLGEARSEVGLESATLTLALTVDGVIEVVGDLVERDLPTLVELDPAVDLGSPDGCPAPATRQWIDLDPEVALGALRIGHQPGHRG